MLRIEYGCVVFEVLTAVVKGKAIPVTGREGP
jgi:hypothetical protein